MVGKSWSSTQASYTSLATTAAWSMPYAGKSSELLEATVAQIASASYDDHRPYQNVLAIVQSSGTGKSRTVHEVAAKVFGLAFNLRSHEETGESSSTWCSQRNQAHCGPTGLTFPHPDGQIRDYLIEQKSRGDATTPFYILLKAIFDEVSKEIDGKDMSAKVWRDHLGQAGTAGSLRDSLYDEAVKNAKKALKDSEESQVIVFTCDD